ncbi:MAG: arginine decarboxylase, pyruvoyl-dependent [Proteobacteria bacterium]|nr:arginine decarboxylase, pyruvoyl-dependent [Pseudomonadota bacterium]
MLIPKMAYLTKGVGRNKEKLTSFEMALRDAGIAAQNLVKVSSIFPPACKLISRPKGEGMLKAGQILFVVLSEQATNEPNRLIAASVGLALPKDRSTHGYLSEHHSYGENEKKAGDYAEDLAASMLATTLGIEFDPSKAWDEKEEFFKMSGKIVNTRNLTQTATGHKSGEWTTVVSAAVLIMEWMESK